MYHVSIIKAAVRAYIHNWEKIGWQNFKSKGRKLPFRVRIVSRSGFPMWNGLCNHKELLRSWVSGSFLCTHMCCWSCKRSSLKHQIRDLSSEDFNLSHSQAATCTKKEIRRFRANSLVPCNSLPQRKSLMVSKTCIWRKRTCQTVPKAWQLPAHQIHKAGGWVFCLKTYWILNLSVLTFCY